MADRVNKLAQMNWSIVTSPIEAEADVVAMRQRARRIAELLGYERRDQTRIATAVSEIARNAYSYGGGGRCEFLIDSNKAQQHFVIRISDQGPGIEELDAILDGQYRSPTGMGLGLVGARRLMDQFSIDSTPGKGTIVELGHRIPRRRDRVTQGELSDIASALRQENASDPLVALREQNAELIHSMEEVSRLLEDSDRLNTELDDTNRGVVALYAELDERAEQLRRASELKSRFFSNMSHEFRTPLNSIMALSRMLLDRVDGTLSGEQERQIGYIKRSAEGLLELVNDLLDLAKVEAGKVDVKPASFRVSNLFGALRGALRPLRTSAAVELTFDGDDDVPEIVNDESKVAQILRNLISNALKFTETGEIRVTARYKAEGDVVVFTVKDTGIGIAPEDQAMIFEEFAQVDSKLQKRVKGTGLGLPLSRSLAELLGGALRVDSVVGQGSIFTLMVPIEYGKYPLPPAELPPDAPHRQVLVIDDDEAFRYVIGALIRSEPGFDVIEADGGVDGLRRARADAPDVIVLDLQMPDIDGFEVLRKLGEGAKTADIPVIVSTSLNVDEDLKSRLPAGCPLLPKGLLSRESVAVFLHDAIASQRVS